MYKFILALIVSSSMLTSVSAAPATQTIQMNVDGLVCAFCAQGINKKLRALDATADVFVSLENHLVAIEPKPGKDITDEQLRGVLTDAGYTVREIRRSDETLTTLRSKAKP